jgi:hypothetical protein
VKRKMQKIELRVQSTGKMSCKIMKGPKHKIKPSENLHVEEKNKVKTEQDND